MTDCLIGVLGGMGPLATADLVQKIIAATPAERDQDHVPMVVWNVPQIPDRQQALAGMGPSPLPVLLEAVRIIAFNIDCRSVEISRQRRQGFKRGGEMPQR